MRHAPSAPRASLKRTLRNESCALHRTDTPSRMESFAQPFKDKGDDTVKQIDPRLSEQRLGLCAVLEDHRLYKRLEYKVFHIGGSRTRMFVAKLIVFPVKCFGFADTYS